MKEELITVRVIPNAKKEEVIRLTTDDFKVKLNVPPEKGRANKRLIELLAKRFNISKSQIDIIKGFKSREKLVMISR